MKNLFLISICYIISTVVTFGQQCGTFLQVNSTKSGCRIGDLDIVGNTLTIEAIFSRTAAYDPSDVGFGGGDLVSKHQDPTNVNYLLRPNSASITTTKGFFSVKANCNVELNKTYHVAMVYDGKFLKLYRNGFLMGQVPASGNLINNDYITTIGATADLSTIYPSDFIGYINEVRIWTVPRTQAQIQQYLSSALPTPDAQIGLQAYYQFNNLLNKQGNTAWDATLLGNASSNKSNASCRFYVADSCSLSLNDGLVAFYPFSGNAGDSSGNGNHPVFNNAQLTKNRFGVVGKAYLFDGSSTYMRIPNSSTLSLAKTISICAWIRVDGFYKGVCAGNRPIMKGIDDRNTGNYAINFQQVNNTCSGFIDSTNEQFYGIVGGNATVAPINKNVWYFVVLTYDGLAERMYVNNKLSYSQAATVASFSNTADLYFGKMNNASFPYWFKGALDDIRIYNRAISVSEIDSLYRESDTLPLNICGIGNKSFTLRGSLGDSRFAASVVDNLYLSSYTGQGEIDLYAWTANSAGVPLYNARTLLKYDIGEIPTNAILSSAKLYLYAKIDGAANGVKGQPTYGSNNTGLLQKITSPWSLTGVNINNLPSVSSSSVVLPQSTNTAQDYVVDITDYAQSWVVNPTSNYGMMLRMQTENNPYNSLIFESGAATDTTKRPRLEICYTLPDVLPATLTSFDVAYKLGQFAEIQFATTNEVNLATIQVEKSIDGKFFTPLASVAALGGASQQYQVKDAAPTNGSYYRLKLINADGSFVYSSVAKLVLSAQERLVRLQPNPIVGAQPLVVTITNTKDEVGAYRLYNFSGKLIAEKKINLQKGINTFQIGELATAVSGTYHLQIVSANQNVNKKVVKVD